MKKTSIILAVTVALSAWSTMAQTSTNSDSGQDGPPPGGGHHGRHHPPMPLFKALDVNNDGVIDATEIANAPAALAKLDKNGDGKLTEDELMPPRPDGDTNTPPPPHRKGHHPPSPLMEALDANGDRVIDATEIANAPAALAKLDKNGDGKLTMEELRPPRPPQDDGGPGPDGGRGPKGDGNDGPPPAGGNNQ